MKNLTNNSFLFNHCKADHQHANGIRLISFNGFKSINYRHGYGTAVCNNHHKQQIEQVAIRFKSLYHSFSVKLSKPPT